MKLHCIRIKQYYQTNDNIFFQTNVGVGAMAVHVRHKSDIKSFFSFMIVYVRQVILLSKKFQNYKPLKRLVLFYFIVHVQKYYRYLHIYILHIRV